MTNSDNCYSAPVNGDLLQIMPWPKFANMTDYQLTAIWTYLEVLQGDSGLLRNDPHEGHDQRFGAVNPTLVPRLLRLNLGQAARLCSR